MNTESYAVQDTNIEIIPNTFGVDGVSLLLGFMEGFYAISY